MNKKIPTWTPQEKEIFRLKEGLVNISKFIADRSTVEGITSEDARKVVWHISDVLSGKTSDFISDLASEDVDDEDVSEYIRNKYF